MVKWNQLAMKETAAELDWRLRDLADEREKWRAAPPSRRRIDEIIVLSEMIRRAERARDAAREHDRRYGWSSDRRTDIWSLPLGAILDAHRDEETADDPL